MTEKDYYKILGIDPQDNAEVIDNAYLTLSMIYHPDFDDSLYAQDRMDEINEAYDILRNPQRRADYDCQIHQMFPASDVADEPVMVKEIDSHVKMEPNHDKNYYDILGINPQDDTDLIEHAYLMFTMLCHPDVDQSDDAVERMKDIEEAYAILSNPEKRYEYDLRFLGSSRIASNLTEPPAPAIPQYEPPIENPASDMTDDHRSPETNSPDNSELTADESTVVEESEIQPVSEQAAETDSTNSVESESSQSPVSDEPVNDQDQDYYALFGVDPQANMKEIKNAYLQLKMKYQAVIDSDPAARTEIQKIEDAFEILSDPIRRNEYDPLYTVGIKPIKEITEFDDVNDKKKDSDFVTQQTGRKFIGKITSYKTWIIAAACVIVLLFAGALTLLDSSEDEQPTKATPTEQMPTRTVTQVVPSETESHFSLGVQFLSEEKYTFAIDEFTKEIENGTQNPEVYTGRGDAYTAQELYSLAVDDYSAALELDPESAEIFMKRADAYAGLKNFDAAIADDTAAILIHPNDPEAHSTRGYHYFLSIGAMNPTSYISGNDVLALTDLDTAIELDPSNPTHFFRRGMVHSYRASYNLAIDDFTQVIKLEPNNIDAYFKRGLAYIDYKMEAEAKTDFEWIISISDNPQFVETVSQMLEEISH